MAAALDYGSTVIGIFNSHDEAENAIRGLKEVGFEENTIGVVEEHAKSTTSPVLGHTAEKTAAFGAAVGLGTGAAWGVGILAGLLPGIGPALVAGSAGVILANATVGAATAGLCGALIGLSASDQNSLQISDDEHTRTIVTVKSEDRADTACAIMNRYQQKS